MLVRLTRSTTASSASSSGVIAQADAEEIDERRGDAEGRAGNFPPRRDAEELVGAESDQEPHADGGGEKKRQAPRIGEDVPVRFFIVRHCSVPRWRATTPPPRPRAVSGRCPAPASR